MIHFLECKQKPLSWGSNYPPLSHKIVTIVLCDINMDSYCSSRVPHLCKWYQSMELATMASAIRTAQEQNETKEITQVLIHVEIQFTT